MNTPTVLYLDFETSPIVGWTWRTWDTDIFHIMQDVALISVAWCENDGPIYCVGLDDFKGYKPGIFNINDRKLVEFFAKKFEKADYVVAQNGCYTAGHMILTSDLKWVPVETLKVGDELLAFNEDKPDPNYKASRRKYEVSKVTAVEPLVKECSEIELETGQKITCSNDHPWLVKRGNHWKWRTTDKLMHFNGQNTLTRVLDVWEREDNYHAGYLASFLDGEGCLLMNQRGRSNTDLHFSISFTQKDPVIIAKLEESLRYFGFKFSVRSYDRNHRDIFNINLLGGASERLRFLGITNPAKFSRFKREGIECLNMYDKETVLIKSITPVGRKEVIGLSTTSRTYIAEGFPVHNSGFDFKLWRTRLLVHNLPPHHEPKELDPKRWASKLYFSSKSQDNISRQLGTTQKMETEKRLHYAVIETGDPKKWKQMKDYNKQDVKGLRENAKKMAPYVANLPNANVLHGTQMMCVNPLCPDRELGMQRRGSRQKSNSSVVQCYQCRACGKYATGPAIQTGVILR